MTEDRKKAREERIKMEQQRDAARRKAQKKDGEMKQLRREHEVRGFSAYRTHASATGAPHAHHTHILVHTHVQMHAKILSFIV